MSSVFDRLQKQLDIRKREQGISPLEIAYLPPNLRQVMRMMLREVVMKHTEIIKRVEAMPEALRMNQADLEAALAELVKQNWLMRYGEGEFTSYKVNLRRKEGSRLGQDIWSSLDARIGASKQGGAQRVEDPNAAE